MMSETCITSSNAATRGITLRPVVVEAATRASYGPARDTISAAVGSASWWSYAGASARRTFSTPGSFAAASAAARQFDPATRMWTGALRAVAADRALLVASLMNALSCSAIRSVVIGRILGRPCLEHAGFHFQLVDEFGGARDLHAGLAPAGFHGLKDLQARDDVDAQGFGTRLLDRLFLRFHDVRERSVARLVQAKIRGHDGRQLQ